ncbi:MAG: hypothetical protein HC848_00860 [Limnobacter sp.]|nr:hypothetical protein [Limnobacter sp.]
MNQEFEAALYTLTGTLQGLQELHLTDVPGVSDRVMVNISKMAVLHSLSVSPNSIHNPKTGEPVSFVVDKGKVHLKMDVENASTANPVTVNLQVDRGQPVQGFGVVGLHAFAGHEQGGQKASKLKHLSLGLVGRYAYATHWEMREHKALSTLPVRHLTLKSVVFSANNTQLSAEALLQRVVANNQSLEGLSVNSRLKPAVSDKVLNELRTQNPGLVISLN